MKKVLIVLFAVLVLATLAACQQGGGEATPAPTQEATAEPTAAAGEDWSVAVTGAEKEAFTKADYDTLEETTFDATKKKKDGSETTNSYTGVLITDVLEFLGATDYETITITASDGYSADITKDMLGEKAILASEIDGEPLEVDAKPLMSVLEGQGGNTWVTAIASIEVK